LLLQRSRTFQVNCRWGCAPGCCGPPERRQTFSSRTATTGQSLRVPGSDRKLDALGLAQREPVGTSLALRSFDMQRVLSRIERQRHVEARLSQHDVAIANLRLFRSSRLEPERQARHARPERAGAPLRDGIAIV